MKRIIMVESSFTEYGGVIFIFFSWDSFCPEAGRAKESLGHPQECVDNADKNKNEEACST